MFLRKMGSGPEPAMLLHCGLGVSAMWKAAASGLEDVLTMTAPDLLGHGRSPDFGIGDVHDQCCDALRPLLPARSHLIGHSFGATLALRLAMEAPEKVASLTLIEPVFFAAARGTEVHDSHFAAESAIFEIFAAGDSVETAKQFNAIWGGGTPWERFPQPVKDQMIRQMGFVVGTKETLWHDVHDMLAPGGLESLDLPVLFLRGSGTVPIVEYVHRGLMARLPQASEIVIEGAGHMLVATHAKEVAKAIAKHIKQ